MFYKKVPDNQKISEGLQKAERVIPNKGKSDYNIYIITEVPFCYIYLESGF